MDLAFSPEDLRFQDEVRSFVADNLKQETVEKNRRGTIAFAHNGPATRTTQAVLPPSRIESL